MKARIAISRSIGAVRTLLAAALLLASANAWSVPSYAQQTGMACGRCHSIAFGPALTAYGRDFKLNGYVWGDTKRSVPIAIMTVVGYTNTARAVNEAEPHFNTNNNFAVNEVAGFYAGRITRNVGAFIEAAYSGIERHTAWGAFDVRYARAMTLGETAVVAGISINNNPTVTDLWNSTPVWGFPATGSDLAPGPEAAPILYDGISERVLGPSVYAMINDHLYLEAGAYFGLSDQWLGNVGLSADDNLHMKGVAPYVRAALQFDKGSHYYSVGLVGLEARLRPDPEASATDRYSDLGIDATYQYSNGGRHTVNANLAYVQEDRSLAASFAAEESDAISNHLNTTHFDVSYAYNQTWIGSLGLFDSSGSRNSGLFAPEEISGSASGSPDSRGYSLHLEYVPFGKTAMSSRPNVNVRIGLQYIAYQRFNGGNSNYDGFGRSASDNNTLFGFVWVAL